MDQLLIVGSELAENEEIRKFLAREGYEASVVSNRHEAAEAIRQHAPLCALVDHQLEGDDGLEVLRALQRVEPSCEVILVTTGGEMDTAIEVLRIGALDYLRKPIDLDQLRIALGRAKERKPQRKALDPPTLLIVEDHEPTRKRLEMVLEKEGYRVYSAGDGADGLAVFEEKRVDVILADLRMPQMTGLELLRATKGRGADTEVIMITGYGDENDVVSALRDGAINFLKKPIDIEQMLLAIEKALEFQRARRNLSYRSRDLELMQQLVVRLTSRLELIVETPRILSQAAREFLVQLVDALPFALVVVGSQQEILFVNRHATDLAGPQPERLSSEWLEKLGVVNLSEEQLCAAFERAIEARPGSIETVQLSRWAFLVMTPLRLRRPDSSELYVALAIRGERRAATASSTPVSAAPASTT